jgi:oxepin-CoA hydrolase/3-oxo-5,6-dehydrosuberyl-CoA semialdehyde dehydrogenase
MQTLSSYLSGQWVAGTGSPRPLNDATTGEVIAGVSSDGLDLRAALAHARDVGGPALRALTFAQRGAMLEALAGVIHSHRDELLELSSRNGGTTRGDGKFDIDGASGTLSWYAYLGKKLGDAKVLLDGDPERVLRSKRFVGQHVYVPRRGVAVHINAFNFPAWGLAEKAAVAWLAGMPVLAKPGTSTALVAHRIVQLWVDSGLLPDGALSLLVGSAGDLLDHVGPQDCVAFTGGSETARAIRGHHAIVANNVRLNVEADSLNASVLGPDIEQGSDTWHMFVQQVVRDLTQKCGQKCTAVRRVIVPAAVADEVAEAMVDRLQGATVGAPDAKGTEIGPVASASQRRSVEAGLKQLGEACQLVWQGERPEGGYFVTPSLFRSDAGLDTPYVHEHEVFGPVATLLTYDGSAEAATALVAAGNGCLVSSVYSNDPAWAGEVVLGIAPFVGRVHWGSRKVHDQSPGPGTVLPNLVHGGPGKAGGGEELGGLRGLHFYQQRTAIQADKGLLDRAFASAGVLGAAD